MKRISLALIVIGISTFFSCSTGNIQPEADEAVVFFYVEEFHKAIDKLVVELIVDGRETPLKLELKAPAAVVHIPPGENLHASGWISEKNDTILNGPESFNFNATAGEISLAPVKIQVINKSQVEVKLLSELDLEYAKGRFEQNHDFAGLQINYPEIRDETAAE
jgi:hypothetical protein